MFFALMALGCMSAEAQPRPRRPRRDAGVDVSLPPPTHGRLESAQVQRVVATQQAAIRRCYDDALHVDPLAQGGVDVRLRIEADGHVSESTVQGDGAAMRRVGECIRRRLATLRFDAPTGGPATVVIPFRFAPEG